MDATPTLNDRDLVFAFESIGDNCELGMLQRHVGIEPLGLLRFAGAQVLPSPDSRDRRGSAM